MWQMSDISTSQSFQSATSIFVNPDGSPLNIFVEAGGVHNRPALVRKLKKAGANICTDPKTAQVILVDCDTDQGRRFIRDWGRDENKVVLKHTWVEKCNAAGRVLSSQDEWGDCLTIDDGQPIGTDWEDGEQPVDNPLPTPRETPVSIAHVAVPLSHTPATTRSRTSSAETAVSQIVPTQSQVVPEEHQYFSNNVHPVLQQFLNGFSSQMQRPHIDISSSYLPQDKMIAIPPQVLTDPQIFAALADAVNFGSKKLPDQLPVYNSDTSYSARVDEQINAPESQYSTKNETDLRSVPSSSRNASPSIQYKPSSSKGKELETSHSSTKNTLLSRSADGADVTASKIFTSKDGRELFFYVQVELQNRKDVVSVIKKNGGRITSEMASADYVILQARRTDFPQLRHAAMELGSPAITANFVHDCAKRGELLDHQPYLHDNFRKRGRDNSEAEVGCDEANSEQEREAKRLLKNQTQREYRKRKREETVIKIAESVHAQDSSSQRKPSPTAQAISQTTPSHQLSPPPPNSKELIPGSKNYKYSDDERKWALDYAKILLQRDHRITYSAIAAALHRKMPHHTLASWKTFVTRDMVEHVETQRRKASIAYRKALSKQQAHDKQVVSEEKVTVAAAPSDVPSSSKYSASQEEDLAAISRFFLEGGDEDGQDDDRIWVQLKAQLECKSERSWEEFWSKHSLEVHRRYEQLLAKDHS